MNKFDDLEITIKEEIEDISMEKPHVLLIGAGASKAALPDGDKYGRKIPLLRDIALDLDLNKEFPKELIDLSKVNFEAAYSKLFNLGYKSNIAKINTQLFEYFSNLQLPEETNLYDVMQLSLRDKDAIATFNWDPFLIQSRTRLAKLGVTKFPKLFFLHGNVSVGYCLKDKVSGVVGNRCRTCREYFKPSHLLYPVENKNYQDGAFIEREWNAVRYFLKHCHSFTIFGYSGPKTDVEALALLKKGWGDTRTRNMEQTEIICKPGADEVELRDNWNDFIHSGHYEIHDSFYDSFLARHPRRSGEAYWNQYIEAKFISDNPIPKDIKKLNDLVTWFSPLLNFEKSQQKNP